MVRRSGFRRFKTGVKRVGGGTYRVIKRGAAWLIMQGGKLLAMLIHGIIYTFSREVGKHLARRIFAAKAKA